MLGIIYSNKKCKFVLVIFPVPDHRRPGHGDLRHAHAQQRSAEQLPGTDGQADQEVGQVGSSHPPLLRVRNLSPHPLDRVHV